MKMWRQSEIWQNMCYVESTKYVFIRYFKLMLNLFNEFNILVSQLLNNIQLFQQTHKITSNSLFFLIISFIFKFLFHCISFSNLLSLFSWKKRAKTPVCETATNRLFFFYHLYLRHLIQLFHQIMDIKSFTFKGEVLMCHVYSNFSIRCNSRYWATYKLSFWMKMWC